MAIRKSRKDNNKVMRGNGNGKISYKARSTSQKLGKYFGSSEEDEEESD